jgi:hypothetical protein
MASRDSLPACWPVLFTASADESLVRADQDGLAGVDHYLYGRPGVDDLRRAAGGAVAAASSVARDATTKTREGVALD